MDPKYNYKETLKIIQDHIKNNEITGFRDFTNFIEKQSLKKSILAPELAKVASFEFEEEDISEIEREINLKYAHLLEDLKFHNPELANLSLNEIIKKMAYTRYGGSRKKYPYPLVRSKRFQHPARGKVFSRSNTKKKVRKHRIKTVRRHRGSRI
jgi:hypothetical protein